MGKTPTPYSTAFILLLAVACFTIINYGCQSGPTNNSSVRPLAALPAASPSPAVIPPWPGGFFSTPTVNAPWISA